MILMFVRNTSIQITFFVVNLKVKKFLVLDDKYLTCFNDDFVAFRNVAFAKWFNC